MKKLSCRLLSLASVLFLSISPLQAADQSESDPREAVESAQSVSAQESGQEEVETAPAAAKKESSVQAAGSSGIENVYVLSMNTLVSRFEANLRTQASPQWLQQKNKGLALAIQQVLAEYEIDNDLTGIALTTLDGTISYYMNPDQEFLAASLYKVPLAALYYDQISAGEISEEDTLPYESYMYEDGSIVAADYEMGSQVPLSVLLETVIVDSDNTAGHILFENLGGWSEFREEARMYSPGHSSTEEFVSMDNVISPHYMNDLMIHIASHADQYGELIEYMTESQPDAYLNRLLETPIPQKYGAYDAQVNSSGFNLNSPHPYVLTVMSSDVQAEMFISDLSLVIEQYLAEAD